MHVNELLLPQISLAKKFLFSFFCFSVMAVAEAGPITAPSELQAGDTFRLIFVTSGTINATSSDISVYDRFVNQQAGGATYNGSRIHFTSIASIATTATSPPTVNAIDHINAGGNSRAIAGVFMVDGTKLPPIQERRQVDCSRAESYRVPIRGLTERCTAVSMFGPGPRGTVSRTIRPCLAVMDWDPQTMVDSYRRQIHQPISPRPWRKSDIWEQPIRLVTVGSAKVESQEFKRQLLNFRCTRFPMC